MQLLIEKSTLMNLVKNSLPSSQKFIQMLHKNGISANLAIEEIPSAPSLIEDWKNVVIAVNEQKLAVIFPLFGTNSVNCWLLYRSSTKYDTHIDKDVYSQPHIKKYLIPRITDELGPELKWYIGKNPENFHALVSQRRVKQKEKFKKQSTDWAIKLLVDKFRPLLKKLLQNAIADSKSLLLSQISAGHYRAGKQRANRLTALQKAFDDLDADLQHYTANTIIAKCINDALIMTAQYFYPEETGGVHQSPNDPYGSFDDEDNTFTLAKWNTGLHLTPTNYAGVTHVLNDLKTNPSKVLKTLYQFTKQEFAHL